MGGKCMKGKTELKIIRTDKKETVNAVEYCKTLEQCCIAEMDAKYGHNSCKLQQDNAKPHSCPYTTNFLDRQGIKRLWHPAYSSDLNPIEHIWSSIKSDLDVNQPKTVDELIQRLQHLWSQISLAYIKNLIVNHINQIKRVLEQNGAYVE